MTTAAIVAMCVLAGLIFTERAIRVVSQTKKSLRMSVRTQMGDAEIELREELATKHAVAPSNIERR